MIFIPLLAFLGTTNGQAEIWFCQNLNGQSPCNRGTAGAHGLCANLDFTNYRSAFVNSGTCNVYTNLNCGVCNSNNCNTIRAGGMANRDGWRSYVCS